MQELLSFIYALGHGVCEFLLTSPIYYFTGVIILLFVAGLVNRIIS